MLIVAKLPTKETGTRQGAVKAASVSAVYGLCTAGAHHRPLACSAAGDRSQWRLRRAEEARHQSGVMKAGGGGGAADVNKDAKEDTNI